jgi:hypothetical protein
MKTKEIKTRELIESPRKEANEEKYGVHSDSCICCGRRQNDKKTEQKYVHMTTGWEMINTREVEEGTENIVGTDFQTQGFWPIGNTCAKKYPKGFIFTAKDAKAEPEETPKNPTFNDAEIEIVEPKKEKPVVKKGKAKPKKTKKAKKDLTNSERKEILAEFIETLVAYGYDIKPYLCKHLGYFDYDAVQQSIKDLKKKHEA